MEKEVKLNKEELQELVTKIFDSVPELDDTIQLEKVEIAKKHLKKTKNLSTWNLYMIFFLKN
jgi:hypothetical protein